MCVCGEVKVKQEEEDDETNDEDNDKDVLRVLQISLHLGVTCTLYFCNAVDSNYIYLHSMAEYTCKIPATPGFCETIF